MKDLQCLLRQVEASRHSGGSYVVEIEDFLSLNA